MLNFYGRVVPRAAAMLLPLYELVNVKGGEFEAAWTTRHDEHFQRSKVALATATHLAHPSATAETLSTQMRRIRQWEQYYSSVKCSLDAHIVFIAQTSGSRD